MAKSRTSRAALLRLIQQSPFPIYAVTEQMKIIFCNDATCRWTGQTDEYLTELVCVYQSASDQPPSRQLATGLCPPPDSMHRGSTEGWVSVPGSATSKSKVEFRRALFVSTTFSECLAPIASHTKPAEANEESNVKSSEKSIEKQTDNPNVRTSTESTERDSQESGVLVFVFGAPRNKPILNGNSQSVSATMIPSTRELHAAICQMQYESASSINIDRLVGQSPASIRIRKQVELAGQNDGNVLVIGPAGSGRRNVPPLIHFANGPEMAGPLVPIDCSICDLESMQETIKTLFRAKQDYPDDPLGRIVLHHVDELTEEAQHELLGFLQLPNFDLPLLATALPGCQARINPALWQFLTTIVIELPALAERRQDIPFLTQAIVEQFNESNRSQLSGIDPDTMTRLMEYSWPGELDELIEAIDFACRNATPPVVEFQDLPEHLRIAIRISQHEPSSPVETIDLDAFLAEIEDELIRRAVECADGNKSEAARLLGISRARLLRRLGSNNEDGNGERPDFVEAD